jgi:hypothetical protein
MMAMVTTHTMARLTPMIKAFCLRRLRRGSGLMPRDGSLILSDIRVRQIAGHETERIGDPRYGDEDADKRHSGCVIELITDCA